SEFPCEDLVGHFLRLAGGGRLPAGHAAADACYPSRACPLPAEFSSCRGELVGDGIGRSRGTRHVLARLQGVGRLVCLRSPEAGGGNYTPSLSRRCAARAHRFLPWCHRAELRSLCPSESSGDFPPIGHVSRATPVHARLSG